MTPRTAAGRELVGVLGDIEERRKWAEYRIAMIEDEATRDCAGREAALREALGWAIDGLVELVNTGWSSLAERHAQDVIDKTRALLSEVPQ